MPARESARVAPPLRAQTRPRRAPSADRGFVEQLRSAVPGGFDVLFDGTGNEVRDHVLALVREGGRGIFIIGGVPAARDGVEFQYLGATTTIQPARGKASAEGLSNHWTGCKPLLDRVSSTC